jgi:F-type H+-transporting ATPase subunit epsilon
MTFHLSIATPEQKAFEAEINSLIVPGTEGFMEILAHHAPILTTLQAGKITLKQEQEERSFIITSGLLEVQNNQAVILVDAFKQ